MLDKGTTQYGPVTTENQAEFTQDETLLDLKVDKEKGIAPRRLESAWRTKMLRTVFDLVVAVISLLFAAYGFLIYSYDGKPVYPGSEAASIVSVAKYVYAYPFRVQLALANRLGIEGPTIFPIVFAAIVGGAMKSLATWRIQRGATIGLVEQLLGSSTISGAFMTQLQFRAFNVLALLIIALWCLSPLGSQASLRVVSVAKSYSNSAVSLSTLDSFTEYGYGGADNVGEAATVIVGPFAAALFSASLLKDRNQDLWGNIRLPSIEHLTSNESTAWMNISDPTDVDYPSLIGLPIVGLLAGGNTTFILSGSYLDIECDTFNTAGNVSANYTGLNPSGSTDSSWSFDTSSIDFTIAISQPAEALSVTSNGTRDPRRLIWDSNGTHAECKLYTTYTDVNVSCITNNVCLPSAAQRSPQPPRDRSWTVFDISGSFIDAFGFLLTFTRIFPNVGPSGIQSPVLEYFTSPFNAISFHTAAPVYSIGKGTFELRLAQLFNVQLLLGIDPSSLTGNFNITPSVFPLDNGTNITQYAALQPSLAWSPRRCLADLVSHCGHHCRFATHHLGAGCAGDAVSCHVGQPVPDYHGQYGMD